MKSTLVAVVLCGIGILSTGAFAAEGARIAYVDVQKVMSLSNVGKKAQDELKEKFKRYQEDINSKQEELKKLKETLERQSSLMTEAAKNSKEKEYQQKLKELQRLGKDADEELAAKDQELTKRIFSEIEKVAQELGRQKGYTFILIKNEMMLYADEKADITEDVIKKYNESKK